MKATSPKFKRKTTTILSSLSSKSSGRRKSLPRKKHLENQNSRRRCKMNLKPRVILKLSVVSRSARNGILLRKLATLKSKFQHLGVQSNSQRTKKNCPFLQMTYWSRFLKKKRDWVALNRMWCHLIDRQTRPSTPTNQLISTQATIRAMEATARKTASNVHRKNMTRSLPLICLKAKALIGWMNSNWACLLTIEEMKGQLESWTSIYITGLNSLCASSLIWSISNWKMPKLSRIQEISKTSQSTHLVKVTLSTTRNFRHF